MHTNMQPNKHTYIHIIAIVALPAGRPASEAHSKAARRKKRS